MQIRKHTLTGTAAILFVSAALVAGAAWAFDTQQSGPAPAPTTQERSLTPQINKDLGLIDPSAALPKQSSGTQVHIPGLGVIGVIPKMDFGLELLYGASDPADKGLQLDNNAEDGVAVQGRVKRSF